jgi:hypothetical protein
MRELGKKHEIFGAHLLRPLNIGYQRPTQMPALNEGDAVIAGYDQGLGERMIVCDTLEDMQQLFDAYARGGALTLTWYLGNDPGFITVL